MKTFNDIWDEQKSFQHNFYNPDDISDDDRIKFTKEYILCTHRELSEVLAPLPWKAHRANKKEYDIEHVQEELIDCFKFLLNICILQGMTPEKFIDVFFKKSKIVRQRYKNEKDKINTDE